MDHAHALEQLAHVIGAAARGRLVGHGADPFDQTGLEQADEAHQQDGIGAVAADPVPATRGELRLDEVFVDRIENDDRVVLHAQRAGRVDPVALPAAGAHLGKDGLGVVAALAGDDDVALRERGDVIGVLQRAVRARHLRCLAARVGGGKEDRLDQLEVALGLHALHQHGADHAAPADEAYQLLAHCSALSDKKSVHHPALLFAPARQGRGRAHDDAGAASARNGRGFGDGCARRRACCWNRQALGRKQAVIAHDTGF